MPQPYIFRTVELDNQSIRTAVRPGKPHLTPLLIFNGIGANLELVFPFIEALDRTSRSSPSMCRVSAARPRPAALTASQAWPS